MFLVGYVGFHYFSLQYVFWHRRAMVWMRERAGIPMFPPASDGSGAQVLEIFGDVGERRPAFAEGA